MLKIQRFQCNMLGENCYVASDETKECIIVDCGAYYPEERTAIVDYICKNELKPVHLVATHGHLDHNFGNNTIYDEFGLKVEVHGDDEHMMQNLKGQAKKFYNLTLDYDFPPVGKYLTGDDVIEFGTHKFVVIETPGHSYGSIFLYCKEEKVAFSGDTLFRGSIGRTDLGGSMFQIIQSLRMISQMDDDVRVLPGHGEETTIGMEVASNPYIDR